MEEERAPIYRRRKWRRSFKRKSNTYNKPRYSSKNTNFYRNYAILKNEPKYKVMANAGTGTDNSDIKIPYVLV